MIQSDLQRRLFAGVCFFIIERTHGQCFGFKNTPELMLLYHGSAVLADMAVVGIAGYVLTGRLSRDIMWINLCAIITNFVGWGLYMKYYQPSFYNGAMSVIIFTQWARLLWVDDVADFLRYHVFRRRNCRHYSIHP